MKSLTRKSFEKGSEREFGCDTIVLLAQNLLSLPLRTPDAGYKAL